MVNFLAMTIHLPQNKMEKTWEGVQTCVSQTGSDGTSADTPNRTPFIFNSSNRTSPSPLPCLVEAPEQSTAAGQGELRLPNKESVRDLQWWIHEAKKVNGRPIVQPTNGRSGNYLRCLDDGMGCNLPEHKYRGFLNKTGETVLCATYINIQLDEVSSMLTTSNASFGHYQWKWLKLPGQSTWTLAVCTGLVGPRWCQVETETGTFTWNRRHLLDTPETDPTPSDISTPPTEASEEAPADPVSDDCSTPPQTSKALNCPLRRSQRARRQAGWFMDYLPS